MDLGIGLFLLEAVLLLVPVFGVNRVLVRLGGRGRNRTRVALGA